MQDNQIRTLIGSARLAVFARDTLKLSRAEIRDELRTWAEREGNGMPRSLIGEIAAFVSGSGEAAR